MKRAIVIASGPSHVLEDALYVYGCGPIIAVNSSIFSVPFADFLFAGDFGWYQTHAAFLDWLPKEKQFSTGDVSIFGVTRVQREGGHGIGGQGVAGANSGHQAISFAYAYLGARQILLLGFDCKFGPDGKKHHHGDHPETLPNGSKGCSNPQQTKSWAGHHLTLAQDARKKGVEIINCSRETALDCYPRASLREAIHGR